MFRYIFCAVLSSIFWGTVLNIDYLKKGRETIPFLEKMMQFFYYQTLTESSEIFTDYR